MKLNSQKVKVACSAGNQGTVRRLLDEGADPNFKDENGSCTLLSFQPAILE